MKHSKFVIVDAGCFMLERNDGRWIIEHPYNGYLPTSSSMWDVLIEHSEQPHSMTLKFLGSFDAKSKAIAFVKRQLSESINYSKAQVISNNFYHEDYKTK